MKYNDEMIFYYVTHNGNYTTTTLYPADSFFFLDSTLVEDV